MLFNFEFVPSSAWFFDQATGLVFLIFVTRGCWKVILYGYMFQIYVKSTNYAMFIL